MAALVEAHDVTFRYGSTLALNALSLSLPAGATGLLGPNGAGKTTLVRLMVGLLPAPSGCLWVNGMDAATESRLLRVSIGLAPEGDILLPGLSAVAYVAYAGRLAGLTRRIAMDRAHMTLHHVGLGADRYRKVEQYSKGMRQRLKLAQALVHDPPFLILDEPTDGMDPKGRDDMLHLLADLASGHGKNLLICTHILDDVQRVCQRALVLAKGKAMGIVDLSGSSERGDEYAILVTGAIDRFVGAAQARGCAVEVDEAGDGTITLPRGEADAMIALARECGAEIRRLVAPRERLESMFTRLVRTES